MTGYLHWTLPDFKHNGSLPHSISNLKMLRTLDLWNCSLHGIIPSSIANLNQIEYVDLSSNEFSGPIPSISSLKNMRILRLQENSLTGSINSTDWGGILNLERIYLSDNSLTGSIPTSLFSMPSFQEISLARNKFSRHLNEFATPLSSILSFLDLSSNQLEGPVPKSIFLFKGLTELNLSWNRFNGTLELNEILRPLQNLLHFDLSHNLLTIYTKGTSKNFPFPQLNFLYLASYNLHIIPEFLKNQSHMKYLDRSNNQIHGRAPSWIWKVGDSVGLYSLNLSCNNFFDLEQPLPHIPSLDILDLHWNNLQGKLPIPTMPSEMGLRYMDYSNNNFTSIDLDISKPLSLAIFLSLSRNNIHGSIPTSLCNATMLQVLDLSYNHLNGKIPGCLIVMTQTLGVLDLRGNNLGGSIPDEFGEGCMLETLDFNRNSLQGKVPKSLDNCTKLKVLNLGNNRINDTFPCQLRSLSDLQVLILRSKKFHGTLVCLESYSIWPLLQIVDLASNQFSGELTAHLLLKRTLMMASKVLNSSCKRSSQSSLALISQTMLFMVCYQENWGI